jgi:uncharacterized protein YyaL (SSP411 family)
LAGLTGATVYRDAADRALAACAPTARSSPRFAGWALAAAEAQADGPVQVAVVGPRADLRSRALVAAAWRSPRPGVVVAWGEGVATPDEPALLEGRSALGGQATAYPCRGFVCDLPVTSAEALASALTK